MFGNRRFITCLLTALFVLFEQGAAASEIQRYVAGTYFDDQGRKFVKIIVPWQTPPENRMPGFSALVTRSDNSSAVVLEDVPAFVWTYGCSATSAGMLAGYYDRTAYPDMYTGPANGGICPLDNAIWGQTVAFEGEKIGESPFVASHQGVDGRETRGHVDDYWYDFGTNIDPYYSNYNDWPAHNLPGTGDCLADFMGTNMYFPGSVRNLDGGTGFYFYTDGVPTDINLFGDGSFGFKLFVESRGYTVVTWYNQLIYGLDGFLEQTDGFTFDQYMEEIDAGRPVIIHVEGHSMVGLGYDADLQAVYLHDTWDNETHRMKWGGSYYNMKHLGVSVFELEDTSPDPLQDVTIAGPFEGFVNTEYAFYAVTSPPDDGNTPITYMWFPEPGRGQGTSEATYSWGLPGLKIIDVTVEKAGETLTGETLIMLTPPSEILCPLSATLESRDTLGLLRKARNRMLNTYFGRTLTAAYYTNAPEVVSILTLRPDLGEKLQAFIMSVLPAVKQFLDGEEASVSRDSMNAVLDLLYLLKSIGGPSLQNDLERVLKGLEGGYILDELGIVVQ